MGTTSHRGMTPRQNVEHECARRGEGANHAFDNAGFALHHPEASALAWQRTLDFLSRTLPT